MFANCILILPASAIFEKRLFFKFLTTWYYKFLKLPKIKCSPTPWTLKGRWQLANFLTRRFFTPNTIFIFNINMLAQKLSRRKSTPIDTEKQSGKTFNEAPGPVYPKHNSPSHFCAERFVLHHYLPMCLFHGLKGPCCALSTFWNQGISN